MTRHKIVIEHDDYPDFSWLAESQYDPASTDYDPVYPSTEDMQARRNAYDGAWYRNPDNHVALVVLAYELTDADDDWRLVDSLCNIDFLVNVNDWTIGTFYRLAQLDQTQYPYLYTLAKERGLR